MKKLILLLLLLTAGLLAQTFNVSTTPELRTALSDAASNGEDDTITLADGTYKTTDDGLGRFDYISSENNILTINGNQNTIIDGNSQDNCLYIKPLGGQNMNISNLTVSNCLVGVEIKSNAIFNSVQIKNNQDYGIYSVIDNSTLKIYDSSILNNGSHGISRASGTNSSTGSYRSPIYIENTEVSGNSGMGIYTNTGSGDSGVTAIDSNISNNGSIGIHVGYGSPLVLDNVIVSNNQGSGLELNYNANLTMNNSYILSNGGSGIIAELNANYILTNSIISQNANYGIYISRSIDRDIKVINSIISNNNYGIYKVMDGPNENKVVIINSIVNNTNEEFIGASGDELFILGRTSVFGNDSTNSVVTNDNGIQFSANDFTDYTYGDYTLTSSSNLIDAGIADVAGFTFPTTDINGNARLVGGNIDIGPYEFSTTRPTINSVTYAGIATELNEQTFTTDYNLTSGRTLESIAYDYTNDDTWTTIDVHTFNTAGTYTVNVKVTDSEGEFSTTSKTVTIAALAFDDMTDEQKLLKTIDPTYYDAIMAIIDAEKESARLSGVTVGENNVVLSPSTFALVTQTASDAAVATATTTGIETGTQYVQDNLTEFGLVTAAACTASSTEATTTGIETGKEIVIADPGSFGINVVTPLSSTDMDNLPIGWSMVSIPSEITDMSVFDTLNVVWFYQDNTWYAYSSNVTTASALTAAGIVTITTLPANSAIWVEK